VGANGPGSDGSEVCGHVLCALLRRLLGREEVRSISRRYFISNGFNGTLTCIGVIVGSVVSGVPDGRTAITIGLGAAVGLTTSAIWSVWEIERAETRAAIQRVERAMLIDLNDTQSSANRAAPVRCTHWRAGWIRS
jgi:hypothetical protein